MKGGWTNEKFHQHFQALLECSRQATIITECNHFRMQSLSANTLEAKDSKNTKLMTQSSLQSRWQTHAGMRSVGRSVFNGITLRQFHFHAVVVQCIGTGCTRKCQNNAPEMLTMNRGQRLSTVIQLKPKQAIYGYGAPPRRCRPQSAVQTRVPAI